MMEGSMIWGLITLVIFLISFAYVVLVLANKESDNMKLAGQILAAFIALVAVVVLFYGITGRGGYPMMGRGMMGGKGMMMMEGRGANRAEAMMNIMKSDPSMLKEMCKNPQMKKMMQDAIKKSAK